MTETELKAYLKELKGYTHLSRNEKYKPIYDLIIEMTSMLPSHTKVGMRVKIILGQMDTQYCPVCGTVCDVEKEGNRWRKTCGDASCDKASRKNALRKTSMERYGVENPAHSQRVKDKRKQTNLERYGSGNYAQTEEYKQKTKGRKHTENTKQKMRESWQVAIAERGEEIVEKRLNTVKERYGVENVGQVDTIKQRISESHKKHFGGHFLSSSAAKEARVAAFGAANYFSTDEFKERVKANNMERYGVEHHFQNPTSMKYLDDHDWLMEQYQTRTIVSIAEEVGVYPSTVWNKLVALGVEETIHGASKVSQGERDLHAFLTDELGVEFESSNRTVLSGMELDIYIPERNVAIEYNGIYWHCEKYRDRKYHQEKSLSCMGHGIQLVHVWEDDWTNPVKREIVKNKLRSKLGFPVSQKVYARKTSIVIPSASQVRSFYNSNHLQGFVRASKHIGLEYEGELVACASFHPMREEGVWDLNRFATSMTVVGGFSKLLSHFKKTTEWNKIVTFAHLDYSHGGVYEKTGFEKIKITEPGMWYTKGSVRLQRQRFMKSKLKEVLENFDPDISEHANMLNHGFYKLYDAGSIRYEMTP